MNGDKGAFRVHTRRQRDMVWLGEHVIVDYVAVAEIVDEYAPAMGRWYASCRVTNEPLPVLPAEPPPLAYAEQDGAR
jgi:hypothetical protein